MEPGIPVDTYTVVYVTTHPSCNVGPSRVVVTTIGKYMFSDNTLFCWVLHRSTVESHKEGEIWHVGNPIHNMEHL